MPIKTSFTFSVIVDASDSCNLVNFNLGTTSTTSRSWDIFVTQVMSGTIGFSRDTGLGIRVLVSTSCSILPIAFTPFHPQYNCGDDFAGPDGCLQYFTGNTGTIASYNFPTSSTTITSGTTHLSSQLYTICFRRESGKCAICFVPSTATTAGTSNNQVYHKFSTCDFY